jgi:biotin carboxylase
MSSELPRLAIVYPPVDLPFLAIVEAGRGEWETIWVLTGDDREVYKDVRALHRFGTVVDVTGLSPSDAAREIARSRPDGITAFRTEEFAVTSTLAHELSLPFHDEATVACLTDKRAQREAMAAAGLPVPGFWSLPALSSLPDLDRQLLDQLVADVRLPVVVKPGNGGSSRNVIRATTAGELRRTVAMLLPDEPSGLVFEEILQDSWSRAAKPYADYLSVESVIVNNVIHHVTVTGRFPLAEPYREVGCFTPANIDADQILVVQDCAARAIRAVGIQTGCTHTEIKLTPDGPRVIEVNGGLGGEVPDLIRLSTDRSIFTLIGRAALGLHPTSDTLPSKRISYLWNVLPPIDAVSLLAVRGYDEAGRVAGVDSIHLRKQPGDRVSWREGNIGYVACITGTVDSLRHDDLWDVLDTLRGIISMDFATDVSKASA